MKIVSKLFIGVSNEGLACCQYKKNLKIKSYCQKAIVAFVVRHPAYISVFVISASFFSFFLTHYGNTYVQFVFLWLHRLQEGILRPSPAAQTSGNFAFVFICYHYGSPWIYVYIVRYK